MEFTISSSIGVPIDFDNKDFLEFSWIYKKCCDKLKKQGSNGKELGDIRNGR